MKCKPGFFGTKKMPQVDISKERLEELAKASIGAGFTVPGVQKKLSLHLSDKEPSRLTLVGYPAGFIALVCLDKILGNIKKDIVCDNKNIKLLNIITICCLYAAVVGAVSFVIIAAVYKSIETVILLAFGEGFMALVVRVVRNIIKKAIEIKEDNDLVV